jgi:hypothetical protein
MLDRRRNDPLRIQLAAPLRQQHVHRRPGRAEQLDHRKIAVRKVVSLVKLLADHENRRPAVVIERVTRAFVFNFLEFDDAIGVQPPLARAALEHRCAALSAGGLQARLELEALVAGQRPFDGLEHGGHRL